MNAQPLLKPSRRHGQRGVGIIETMVGLLIGMIVVLVIYNTLIVAEGYKRSTIGVSDAQITGQLAQFVLNRELSSGGNGVMSAMNELALCSNWRLRPIPALIEDRSNALGGDAITVFYSNSTRITHPVAFGAASASPAPYQVISPNGFQVNDFVIASRSAAGASECNLVQVTGITQDPPAPFPPAGVGGRIQLSYSFKVGDVFDHDTGSRAINMGPLMTRTTYSVNAAKQQLDSLNDSPWVAGITPVPVAQNVVLMKAQYGVDINGDNLVDCWTPADNANICGNGIDYSIAAFQANPAAANNAVRLRSIKAVRVAIVVRSDDDVKPDAANATLVGQERWLFDCAPFNGTCPGNFHILPNTVLENYRRYRVYEATIPLRNALWHPT